MSAAGIAGSEQLETIHLDSRAMSLREQFGAKTFVVEAKKKKKKWSMCYS